MIIRQIKSALLFTLLLAGIADAGQVKMRDELLKPYNDKMELNLMLEGNEIGTGYYSTNKKGTLDGPIQVESKRSGHDKQVEANYLFITAVTGNFKNGKKDGIWKYKYVYDDGIDLCESHEIEIVYMNNECIRSSFNGVIGHMMPKTRYGFESQQHCTPQAIRNKVWEIWRAEFDQGK